MLLDVVEVAADVGVADDAGVVGRRRRGAVRVASEISWNYQLLEPISLNFLGVNLTLQVKISAKIYSKRVL